MIRAARWLWKRGILSTFLAGLFAVLPIVITVGIMAWVGGLLKAWLGPESFVGKALFQMGLRLVTDPIVASVLGWVAVLLAIWFGRPAEMGRQEEDRKGVQRCGGTDPARQCPL